MKTRYLAVTLALVLLVSAVLTACGPAPIVAPAATAVPTAAPAATSASAPATEAPAQPAIPDVQIVAAGQTFDAAALSALGVVTLEVETPKGEKRSYTGVLLQDLLEVAGVSGEAITLVAKDGYEAEVKLSDLTPESMLAFGEAGLDAVLPGLAGGAWVRDLAEIVVAGAAEAAPLLTIDGKPLTLADLEALEQVTAEVEGKSYRGVRLLDALEAAGVTGGEIVFRASDGYEAGVAVEALTPACLLAYEEGGTVGAVLPDMDHGLWVRMLSEIAVQGGAGAGAEAKAAEAKPAAVPADAIIVVNDKPFTLADLQALPQVEAEVDGTAYEGASFLAVLEAAGVKSGSILMTAGDGYAAGISVDALTEDCMLAYEKGGTVGAVLPGQSKGGWVKMIATITVDEGASTSGQAPVPTRAPLAAGESRVIVDSLGKEVTIPVTVSRVASMRTGTTEIICALGQADKIVAVDEMVKSGEDYGEFIAGVHPELMERSAPYRNRDINAEELLRLEPDLVLHGGYGRIQQAEALQKQVPDLPVVIAHFETIEHYMDDVRIVAQCVNAEAAAEKLIATLQGTIDFVSERVKDIPEKDKVRVFYGGHDIYHAYTSTTFEHSQIVVAGGANVAGEMEGWHPEISPEQLIVWDPQVIVVLNGVDVAEILADPKVQGVSAIKDKRVYALPEASWDFSSPRALFCIEWLAHKLYPERFADVDIDAEADAFYNAVFGVGYSGPVLGSGKPVTTTTRVITDSLGRKVQIPAQVRRAVSLHSDLTAIVFALGAGDRVAAVDSMSTGNKNLQQAFPEVAKLPAPCAFYNANAESILAVDPDVVLTVSWQKDPDKLQETIKVPVVCIDLNFYEPSIRLLAALLGAEARADEMLSYYQERMAAIHGALQDVPRDERVRVYVGGGDGMNSTYGAESTWHYEILDAGGVNVAAALTGGGAHGVSMEQIMLWDPQVVILDTSCPDDVQAVLGDARWSNISAVKAKRVYKASPGYVGGWGRPHLESAMARVWLADKLYPDLLKLDMPAEAAEFYQSMYGRPFSATEVSEILGD